MQRNLVAFAALAFIAGCGGGKQNLTDDFTDLAGQDEKSDQFSKKMTLVGSLDYGQTSSAVKYHNPPLYRSFKFGGAKGDAVDIWVRSTNGDAVAWLVDNSFKIISSNDDSSASSTDSHITATLPGNTNASIITYYIIFREYYSDDATFTVSLKGPAKDFYACSKDADCVAIPEGGCCPHGYKVAVNQSSVAAYNASVVCTTVPRPLCPLFLINDTRVSECNTGTGKCELVQPADIACGGFTTNPHKCTDGYTCQANHIPDVPGICVQNPQTCGGIAGIQCPAGLVCVDNPNDNCDPANGGADCGGICQTCVQKVLCTTNSHFDTTYCQCVPNTCIQNVLCITLDHFDHVLCKCVPN